ncbi:MAG: amidohydrolase family protein [Gemmatimonadaceae bacterium]
MTRFTADWVLPVSAPAIASGEVEVVSDRIAYIGPARDGERGDLMRLGRAVLLPGLVNTHTHLELTAMRGFIEEMPFRPWLLRLTNARQSVLSRDALLTSARAGIAEGLVAGITTFADTCESGVVLEALVEMEVRGVMYQEVFGPDPAQCAESLRTLQAKVDALRERQTPQVTLGVSPHAPYTVSASLFSAVTRYARDAELPMAVHAAEGEDESLLILDGSGAFGEGLRSRGIPVSPSGESPIALLERSGVLEARPLLIHCVRSGERDIASMAKHDCAIAHCPASNAKLGHGIAPLTDFLSSGIRVGLGSDSVASNNRMDMLDEARVAVLMQRARLSRCDILPAEKALWLATAGGATALDMQDAIGTLEVGKRADLAAFSLGAPRTTPAFAPEDALLWALAGHSAILTVVAGKILVRDGALVSPRDSDLASVAAIGNSLASWLRDESAPV